jgi:cell wall-associated NlpC family hydrolase
VDRRFVVSAAAAGIVLAVISGHGSAATPGAPGKAAAQAIAYAQEQLGKPYLWGGAGPGAFDCSGLAMEAYQAAGVSIPRTAAGQWAAGPQVSTPQAGDLVFFRGADGSHPRRTHRKPLDTTHPGNRLNYARNQSHSAAHR